MKLKNTILKRQFGNSISMPKDNLDEEFFPEDPQKKSEEGEEGGEEGNEDKTVKVGDKEIPEKDLAALIARGEAYNNLQEKYPSIKFEGLAKDYTEKSSRLSEFEKVKAEQDVESKKEQVTEAQEQAKKQVMGVLSPEIQKMIKDELSHFSAEGSYEQQMAELQKELVGGEDQKPKFEREEIEKYMKEEKIGNPKIAYEYKHREELKEWDKEHPEGNEKNVPYAEKLLGGGMNVPKPKKLENFEDAETATEELMKGSG